MKRPNRWLVLLVIVALIGSGVWYFENHLGEDEIAQQVKSSLQQSLDTGALANAHLQVLKVSVLHDQGNRYQAIATVTLDGNNHDVPLSVLVDGKKVAWQSANGAFAFAIPSMMQHLIDNIPKAPSAAPAETAAPPAVESNEQMPPYIAALTAQWETYNESCRGGSGDDPATARACAKRDDAEAKLHAEHWCWGHKDDIDANRTWVACAPGDS